MSKRLAPRGMNAEARAGSYAQQGGKALTANPNNPVTRPWSHNEWGKGWLAAEKDVEPQHDPH